MTLTLLRGGATVYAGSMRHGSHLQGLAAPNAANRNQPDSLTDDPAARRRELLVVLELCAARERGALILAGSG